MFLDESEFDMDNPFAAHGRNNEKDGLGYSGSTSRPSTASSRGMAGQGYNSLDMTRGRHSLTAGRGLGDSISTRDTDREDDSLANSGGFKDRSLDEYEDYSRGGGSGNSRARMLAQQRDIQLKKRMSAVQAGGMVRSSFENPLAMPNKPPSRPQTVETQFTPAVRQFSAPKSISNSEEFSASEFSGAKKIPPERDPIPLPRDKRPPPDRPPARRSYVDDEDDDEEDTEFVPRRRPPRGGHESSDEEYPHSNANRRKQPPRDNPRRSSMQRDYDEDTSDHERDRRPNKQYSDDEDSVDRYGSRNANRRGSTRRESDSRSSYDRHHDDDNDWDKERETQTRNFRSQESRRDGLDSRDQGQWSATAARRGERDNVNHFRESDDNTSPRSGPAAPVPLNLTNMKAFLTTPIPKSAGIVQCYIRRFKTATSLYPTYNLYLKDGDRFLLTAKKRPNNKTSNYLISMVFNDLSRDSSNYLGKVRSNFVGTEFQIYDNGVNPEKADPNTPDGSLRKDLGAVMYAANILGTRGPRKMQVCLPAVDESDHIMSWNSSGKSAEQDDIITRIKDRNFRDLVYLINKPPRWNEQVGAYVLNFNGRVTMASVKNFQLVDPDEQNAVVLQFGRVSKDEFSMDMQWPVSPLQAFAITMTSFDSKIACD